MTGVTRLQMTARRRHSWTGSPLSTKRVRTGFRVFWFFQRFGTRFLPLGFRGQHPALKGLRKKKPVLPNLKKKRKWANRTQVTQLRSEHGGVAGLGVLFCPNFEGEQLYILFRSFYIKKKKTTKKINGCALSHSYPSASASEYGRCGIKMTSFCDQLCQSNIGLTLRFLLKPTMLSQTDSYCPKRDSCHFLIKTL